MWQSDTDRDAATQHERQARSVARLMVPMLDVASLVERTPESDRRWRAEHDQLTQTMTEHKVSVGQRPPGALTRLTAWAKGYLAGLLQPRVSSKATGRR